VIVDDDAAADGVFRELVRRFPDEPIRRARLMEDWLVGVQKRTLRRRGGGVRCGILDVPRADHAPAWLYWSARAHDQIGEATIANERYRIELADYGNSYYGRLTAKIVEGRSLMPVSGTVTVASTPTKPPIPTAAVVRQLVALGLYDVALKELQFAQRAWGNSPPVEATIAWIRHEQAQNETAPERFDHLRGAINIMKRAYPQYLAAGGQELPAAVLEVIYPLDYWPLIEKYSKEDGVGPLT
jgi:soluble lytic murein transglycosylase-like protein